MPAAEHYLSDLLEEFPSDIIEDVNCEEIEDNDQDFADNLTKYILTIPKDNQPKRGDLVRLHGGNRNDGIFFWTGKEIICYGTNYSEYGHVPDYFSACEEFPPNHWENVMEYNSSYIHVHPHYLMKMRILTKTMKTNESGSMQFMFVIDNYIGACYFEGEFGDNIPSREIIRINELYKFRKLIEERRYVTHCRAWGLEGHNIGEADFFLVIHN